MERPTIFRIDYRGQSWTGAYVVEEGKLHVGGAYQSTAVSLGARRPPEAIARETLRGLVDIWLSIP